MSMNLLPKSHVEFGKEKFWDDFFSKLKSEPFEWYGEYDSLCEILNKYIRTRDNILVVGCGNSKLSADLYDVGFQSITNVDISATVVQQMTEKYAKKCPAMSFERMDVFEMTFDDDSYNVVLDKGTLDAILVDTLPETIQKVDRMFSEISRVLKFGGRYLCISLLQEHILRKLLEWFGNEGWMIRVNRCTRAENSLNKSSVNFPVFAVVCTKMKKIPGSSKVLELALGSDGAVRRIGSEAEVLENVKSVQYFALMKHSLGRRKLKGDDVFLDLCCAQSGKAKYRLYVVDLEKTLPLKFAVFIVPQGRETDWLFSTPEGRKECATSANYERLVVVHLLRDFEHRDIDEVKKELSANVMQLAPSGLKCPVPFLSAGDNVGYREIQMRGESALSGEYIVEDVQLGENELYRRLIFSKRPYIVQSEVKLKRVWIKKKKIRKVFDLRIDFDYLACEHHTYMISGLSMLGPNMKSPSVLQIGLGGGGLAMYLYKHVLDAKIVVVELDPAIVEVAVKRFGLIIDQRLAVVVGDGLAYVEEVAQKGVRYDVVMLDVDSKDESLGISCPPPEFVTESFLKTLSELVRENGILLLNLACRDTNLKAEVCSRITSVFKIVYHKQVEDEINDVLFCTNAVLPQDFASTAVQLDRCIQTNSNAENCFKVETIMSDLQKLLINPA